MGAKGQLCKEHRFWHGELASCKDITISEILGCYFECGNVLSGTQDTQDLLWALELPQGVLCYLCLELFLI